uniref:uncharacterized protein LOC120329657 n=1 Tax=Styela clava TaxID=7725 RepID=UPI0019394D65|nr:uncharacterized protein LOC120329657 [Styela clava]
MNGKYICTVLLVICVFLTHCTNCLKQVDQEIRKKRSTFGRCRYSSPSGIPVKNPSQTRIKFLPNRDGTKYNYNEVLHKSILFYEAQRSGYLPKNNRILWRGDSGLKDGCDIKVDLTGGWYNAGDLMKFNFPMAFTLTMLSWGGIQFRDAYEDAGEIQNLIQTIKWGTNYFIKCHISKYELVGQIGHGKTDHENWGRPEELSISRPTRTITARKPGSELAGETAAALAASSMLLEKVDKKLSASALDHAKELFEFADKYRGAYHNAIPDAASYYQSFSGYEDELAWAAAWLFKATKNETYLEISKTIYNKIRKQFSTEEYFSWDSKFIGVQALLADITGDSLYRNALSVYLDGLENTPTTPEGLYYLDESGPNRYAGNAALLCVFGASISPALPRKESYITWAEKQIGLLIGSSGQSFLIGFGKNYPKRAHHRSSSCPPYPEKCDWSTYHSTKANPFLLYGGLVGGPDKNGLFNDKRDEHQQNQVACNYNAGFQSAVAGLKHFAMKKRIKSGKPAKPNVLTTAATTVPTTRPITPSRAERFRCSTNADDGILPSNPMQTSPKFKANEDGTKYNLNEVLHKSILFYEAQRAGKLPRNNRIPWRGDSALKDGCDVKTDLSGGWYDGGDYVKFGLPMAFTVTTLSWGGILFRDSYDDAGELENLIESIKWATEYLIKAHISKYEFIGQIGSPKTIHSFWGRAEAMNMDRPSYKITAENPGTEVVAESAAALAASSIFLSKTDPALSKEALKHAKELYEFADKYRGTYIYAIPQVSEYYDSHSGYNDELIWGALWLYKATNQKKYLNKAIKTYNKSMSEFETEVSFTWDAKFISSQALLAEITGDDIYRTPFSQYLDTLEAATTTPQGLYYFGDWAPNRYTGGAAFMAVFGALLEPPLPGRSSYYEWAKNQINLLLGDAGQSYMVGFGDTYPQRVHHRSSSCPPRPENCDWSTYHSPSANHFILYGALVGGPKSDGYFRDERHVFEGSQVGIDYNAGFQSSVAGLKHIAILIKQGIWKVSSVPQQRQDMISEKVRCAPTSREGVPVYGAIQTAINFKPNTDDTKYNYNEVLHKSILFYEAQRSGPLPSNNRIPWRGDSGLKDGCDKNVDATGGWYAGGDHVKFNFPMAFSLTTLAWGGIQFRDAYKDAGEYHNMIDCMKWTVEYFIKCHVSKYELIAQVGSVQDDHNYWGRAEELKMARPTYMITKENPGTELAAEVAAALAASSIFFNESYKSIAGEALEHAKELFEFADLYRGSYGNSIPAASYSSYYGFEDELIWAASWLYKATGNKEYLYKAIRMYDAVTDEMKQEFSWDYKLVGAVALLADITKEDKYRTRFSEYLNNLQNSTTTPKGLYHFDNGPPNRYTGSAAFMSIIGANLKPTLPRAYSYMEWAEKQVGMLLGDNGMSYVIGFGENYPLMPHHRSSSCPPYPQRCDWQTTYHSYDFNYYILFGALVGGPDKTDYYRDSREAFENSQVACDYNAGFQSAVAGLKAEAMRTRSKREPEPSTSPRPVAMVGRFFFRIINIKTTPVPPPTRNPNFVTESRRCAGSAPAGTPVFRGTQTPLHFKPNNDRSAHNYNEVLHKSILFFEAQRSGKLPSSNRIPWRGNSGLKDGCDIGVDLSGGWYDAGDFVKFGFPMAFSLTTLAWGGIHFRDAYKDAGEYHHMVEAVKWPTEYFIKAHLSKYELVAQVGNGKQDHSNWGRPETMSSNRPTYKITAEKPGSDLAAETAAALAAASIFLDETHPKLAAKALAHAQELFEFADTYRGLYHKSVPEVAEFYKSFSGYEDELIWGAAWLYKATKNEKYLINATENYNNMKDVVEIQYHWDRKLSGAQVLLADLTGNAIFRKPLIGYLNIMLDGDTTPQGLYYHTEWGPNRHTAGAAFIAMVAATLEPPLPRRGEYLKWARKQVGLLLGNGGRSFVVGYGKRSPTSPHHRSSTCPPYPQRCDWSTYNSAVKNHFTLYGALVGGPNKKGIYHDKRNNVKESEVACDYNACFQSAIAGMKHFAIKDRSKPTTTTKPPITTATSPKTTTITQLEVTTKKKRPKGRIVKRVKCKPKDSPRCKKARARAQKRTVA